MVVEQTTVSVSVTRLPIRLIKVAHPHGHQLVVGGRLVSETVDGKTVAHPELPEYTREMFPGDFDAWCDFRLEDVQVLVRRLCETEDPKKPEWRLTKLGVPRASVFLFTARDPQTVRDWIRSQK